MVVMAQMEDVFVDDVQSTQWPVYVRPLGMGWKFRVSSEDGVDALQAALSDEGFECTTAAPVRDGHYAFVARNDAARTWAWLKAFLQAHPDFRLMLEPA